MQLETKMVPISKLTAYENNAKIHTKKQIEHIANSIRDFGFNDPVGVWTREDGVIEIVTGHGAVQAAASLGMTEVPCNYLDHLTDEQRREYCHIHNQTQLETGFDTEALIADMDNLDCDWENYGFEAYCYNENFDYAMKAAKENQEEDEDEEYLAFVDKFKLKKTTDDCYTPELVYEAVADWVSGEYGVDRGSMVRPFYPGGDYQRFKYPDGCCVVDNPPFSILAEIADWYIERDIPFFLFSPSLTAISSKNNRCTLCVGAQITYENGADVGTSFMTNLDDCLVRSAPTLYEAVKNANAENLKDKKKEHPKYSYPMEVVKATDVNQLSKYHIDLRIFKEDAAYINALDSQKEAGKTIYGGGCSYQRKQQQRKQQQRKQQQRKQQLKFGNSQNARSK